MSVQILFSTEDPCGDNSNTSKNYYNHMYKPCRKGDVKMCLNDNTISRLKPRGKAYWNLMCIQMDEEFRSLEDEISSTETK